MNIVWFKRDLRIQDNEALTQASLKGPVLPLYILEPELWQQADMSYRHYIFLIECLNNLDQELQKIGQKLIIKIGNAVDILSDIHRRHHINALCSHQETWNGWTYERDKAVKKWCKSNHVAWHEPTQNGVIRRLNNRNGWAENWHAQMIRSIISSPTYLQPISEETHTMPSHKELGLNKDIASSYRQKGGRHEGLKLLHSFLYHRGEHYTKEMSSPVTAFDSCSRLSAHIAFGTLSMREIFQHCERRYQDIKNIPHHAQGKWPNALRSFSARLHWHCHFIQKLEDEPEIEFQNIHPAYNHLRQDSFNDTYFTAWKNGMTGYPMVDACMRALKATGWLNFRMRAMLMSFASYHLWLDWQKPALYLATLFTDYEPGIHYSQAQMQSGTTGINSIRIYNPIKQGIDHDPDGLFIRHWIPELRNIAVSYTHLTLPTTSRV